MSKDMTNLQHKEKSVSNLDRTEIAVYTANYLKISLLSNAKVIEFHRSIKF